MKILLEETPVRPENAPGLAERLAELTARVEQQPQLSAVRPATIALRNLIVTLRRAELSASLPEELETARETLTELLADETFGIETEDVRAKVDALLRKQGAHACAICKYTELAIDPVYVLVKPFPSDPALAPSQLPCAIVTCKHCGEMRFHDLAVLGLR
jgi:hypothetical protein